ncbi:CoA-transferase [Clostridium sp. CCUG 7971]|uniref:CoA-transferase n=1 Tax=Clostridium sp. CCUG 7971 TaxID=2811414 RepID=UPI002570DCD8|nr:CoA-transferase [Clostridium sp. CCUG 7971]
MSKVISVETLKNLFKDDMTIMVGGFLGCGTGEILIDSLIESGAKNLTIIGMILLCG